MSELKTIKDVHVMITEFPDGIVIGWDSCSGCFTSVKKCKCNGGPQHPKIFDRWLAGDDNMPRYNDPDRHKPQARKDHVQATVQAAVADTAASIEEALDDPRVLEERIASLQALADEELAANGNSDRFKELQGKLTPLYDQRKTTEVTA